MYFLIFMMVLLMNLMVILGLLFKFKQISSGSEGLPNTRVTSARWYKKFTLKKMYYGYYMFMGLLCYFMKPMLFKLSGFEIESLTISNFFAFSMVVGPWLMIMSYFSKNKEIMDNYMKNLLKKKNFFLFSISFLDLVKQYMIKLFECMLYFMIIIYYMMDKMFNLIMLIILLMLMLMYFIIMNKLILMMLCLTFFSYWDKYMKFLSKMSEMLHKFME